MIFETKIQLFRFLLSKVSKAKVKAGDFSNVDFRTYIHPDYDFVLGECFCFDGWEFGDASPEKKIQKKIQRWFVPKKHPQNKGKAWWNDMLEVKEIETFDKVMILSKKFIHVDWNNVNLNGAKGIHQVVFQECRFKYVNFENLSFEGLQKQGRYNEKAEITFEFCTFQSCNMPTGLSPDTYVTFDACKFKCCGFSKETKWIDRVKDSKFRLCTKTGGDILSIRKIEMPFHVKDIFGYIKEFGFYRATYFEDFDYMQVGCNKKEVKSFSGSAKRVKNKLKEKIDMLDCGLVNEWELDYLPDYQKLLRFVEALT